MATRIVPTDENPKGSNYGGSATVDTLAFYGAIGGVSYAAYAFALQGSFQQAGFEAAAHIYALLHGQSVVGLAIPKGLHLPANLIATATPKGKNTKPPTDGSTTQPPATTSPPSSDWVAAPGNDGWFWDMRGAPGYMFHFGTDITDDANWWPNNGAPPALAEFHAQTGR